MLPDKEIKKKYKKEFWKKPEKYYAIEVLKDAGFERKKCKKCGMPFWTTRAEQETCDDPNCSGGYRFIGKSPAKADLDYIETWKTFARLFKKWGYQPIPRYPAVARWRSDVDFVQASIFDFQPYVVSGEVKPPANPLVVPQFCLRFNDIDNVGITGAHYTGFVMIGQHAFMPEAQWDQKKYFTDIYNWLRQGLKLPDNEITFHEDAWAGGGNFGPCMEFFSRGLELGNQVYMMYEQTPSGQKEINLRVLDMGMGHERNTWFTKATTTSYESVFPTVVRKLHKVTGVKSDNKFMKSFLPYASYLNIDEVEDIDKAWASVGKKLGMEAKELKQKAGELAAMYSIGEHLRSLLVAISDGALPSNVGGGYNLRIIFRRALSLADKHGWDIPVHGICEEHARYLKPLFPELSEHLENVKKILGIEKKKYENTKEKSRQIVSSIISRNEKLGEEKLVELYDSQGIAPDTIREAARQSGKEVRVPEDFFTKVAARHERRKKARQKQEGLELKGLPETEILYHKDYAKNEFRAQVLKIKNNKVILDKTLFYPTSGGQIHDVGELGTEKVIEVLKQGGHIIHIMEHKPQFKEGMEVRGQINMERRKQLAQHHTATHIVNAAARKVLGEHINQAGAKKETGKAHLDITHYQAVSDKELMEIEKEANKIVNKAIKIKSFFLPRDEAEKRFGMSIYQGGAVPGKKIRIVEIPSVDTEACGGTHLNNTKETGRIKMLKSTKIQDGIVRLTFVAGKVAEEETSREQKLLDEIAEILGVKPEEVPARAEELFKKWKKAKKAAKKGAEIPEELFKLLEKKAEKLNAKELLEKTANIFKTQIEHVAKTAKRFMKDLEKLKKRI